MATGRAVFVAAVLLASVAALAASSGLAVRGTADELLARDRLRAAAAALAAAVPGPGPAGPSDDDNRRMAAAVGRALADYPGVEGGVYLADADQFAGAVGPAGPAPDGGPKGKKSAGPRRDPPPKETPAVRRLARDALALGPADLPLVEVRDVGPSRVGLAAAPVGAGRPARAAVWTLVRLSGPDEQRAVIGRLRLATGLALAGVLLALGLAAGLVRSLGREHRRRDLLRDDLRRAEHMAGLGRMLAGVAHEVRNPLAAIRSTVQLWERLPAASRTPESLAAVVGAVDRIDALVGRLLLFARAGHEDRRPVDVAGVAAETAELVRAQADARGVTVAADSAPGPPPVLAAGQAVRQAVLNLVLNAVQAAPPGGRVVCRARAGPHGGVELLVTDTGPGVPAADRDRVFEPFYTTRADGTGLGLALARAVARQHGGDVTLDPGGPGATFRLSLPAAPEDV